jgi:shikimate 5-dehydrogenase
MSRYNDIIIQATSMGMEPNIEEDPMPDYRFTGKETVMDVVYKPAKTRFLSRAEEAGCGILNGYDMLLRQARYQYKFFIGRDFPVQLMSRIRM